MSAQKNLFVFIVGCGRLGSYLANRLSREGHNVATLDTKPEAFQNLSSEYSGLRFEGDATEIETLRHARIDKANLVIAATTSDNVNIMVAQIASKLFNVPRVMARVFNAEREEVYRSLGIETICPTQIAGNLFLQGIHSGYEGSDKIKKS
jgi:trk system potassium uptake protein TrkA